ncbi:DUF3810 domain-containing protein [Eubacteriales bacterium OttesenSCG-928-N13]|nr:DUF3810 domain-containing protein [Eubacteriales bacterium OttesenSCG-928-N13]
MRRIVYGSLLALCALMAIGFHVSAPFAALVGNSVSLPMSRILSTLSSATIVPIGEALTLMLALWLLIELVRAMIRCFREKRIRFLSRLGEHVLLAGSVILLSYVLLWVPLYQVPMLTEQLNITSDSKYALSELMQLCHDLTDDANRLKAKQSDNQPSTAQISQQVQDALSQLDGVSLSPQSVKIARYPELFKAIGAAGVYFPWTGETIISDQEPSLSLPFLIAHESAHQAGFAREDEANYIAYLACKNGDAQMQYSGAMYALYYAMEALHDADTISWTEARMNMSKAVQRDYYRMNGLRNAEEPRFVKLKQSATEAYLRIIRQQNPRSYGDMVDLMLAARRTINP